MQKHHGISKIIIFLDNKAAKSLKLRKKNRLKKLIMYEKLITPIFKSKLNVPCLSLAYVITVMDTYLLKKPYQFHTLQLHVKLQIKPVKTVILRNCAKNKIK